jgi:hypothetical protein
MTGNASVVALISTHWDLTGKKCDIVSSKNYLLVLVSCKHFQHGVTDVHPREKWAVLTDFQSLPSTALTVLKTEMLNR